MRRQGRKKTGEKEDVNQTAVPSPLVRGYLSVTSSVAVASGQLSRKGKVQIWISSSGHWLRLIRRKMSFDKDCIIAL